ncbi:Hypothetical_protein [Hexamita inflata]|uniref:Hypothetical_protein n=1 Tax=Hexamita inflata TaxID=28002 RepID=A0ABP1HJ62_9EUKA
MIDSRRLNLLYQCDNSICDQNKISCLTRYLFISQQYQVELSFFLQNFRILNCSLLKVESSLSIRSQLGHLVNYRRVVNYEYRSIKATIPESLINSITSTCIHLDFHRIKKLDGRNNIVIQIESAIQSDITSLLRRPVQAYQVIS